MPIENYIISLDIDIGTTHVKALLSDLKARIIDVVLQDYRTLYPGPGMVEQDPDELLEATINSISELILKNNIKSNDINKFKVKTILGIVGGSDGSLSHLGSLGSTDNKISLTVGTGSAIRLLKHNPTVIPGKEAWCYYLAENKWLLGGVVHDAGLAMRWFLENIIAKAEALFKAGANVSLWGWRNESIEKKKKELTDRGRAVINHIPFERFGEPDELSGAVIFLASKAASGFVTGVCIPIDGGYLIDNI